MQVVLVRVAAEAVQEGKAARTSLVMDAAGITEAVLVAMTLVTLAVAVQFVSSGPVQLASSHQQTQGICNAYLFWIMDTHTADAGCGCWHLDICASNWARRLYNSRYLFLGSTCWP